MKNLTIDSIIVGCNYHTSWQSHKAMRFVLKSVEGEYATLYTRTTGKTFRTKVSNLIFILTPYNIDKAKRLIKENLC